jgi:predicted AlkP superfamily phosphohydrolase/phosphomutase
VELIDDRLRTFREQLGEPDVDVAHCTVFYVNVLQHFFYRGDPTRDAWKVIDEHVGAIREAYPDATLMLMSDHGCQDIDTVFYANSWLEAEGYLATDEEMAASALDSPGTNKERIGRLAHRLGVHDLLTRLTPDAVKGRVPDSDEGFRRERKLDQVDWDRTTAIASGQGLVYVVDGGEETRDELIADLRDLKSDIDGRPIASAVYTAEEAYNGPYTDRAPDIVFDQRPGVHTSGAIGSNPVFAEAGQWEAENVRTGFFCAAGPAVTADELDPISIMDIAPTVLHSVGCAVPDDMDGTPLPLFGDRPVETGGPVVYGDVTASGGRNVRDRLEDLGCLG